MIFLICVQIFFIVGYRVSQFRPNKVFNQSFFCWSSKSHIVLWPKGSSYDRMKQSIDLIAMNDWKTNSLLSISNFLSVFVPVNIIHASEQFFNHFTIHLINDNYLKNPVFPQVPSFNVEFNNSDDSSTYELRFQRQNSEGGGSYLSTLDVPGHWRTAPASRQDSISSYGSFLMVNIVKNPFF